MTPLHIACPHCGTANRLPGERLAEHPTCGRCRQPLFTGEPVALGEHWQTFLQKTDIPVILDCWAPWCAPCRSFAPIFAQAARQLEPRLRLAKLDTEAHPQAAAALGIRSIPTLIAFRQGREVARQSGALPLPSLLAWARQFG